jgi:RNA polymerase sigma-70 factor (ECF subfamily)
MKQPPVNTNQNSSVGASSPNPQGFAARYTEIYGRLVTIAAGVSGDYSSAEDIVQQGAAIALERQQQYTAGTNFAAWLAEIVRRVALNHLHRNQRRRTFASSPQSLDALSAEPLRTRDPHDAVAAGGELVDNQAAFDDHVVRALGELEPTARCCLLLRVVHELPYEEIAQLLGIPQGTAMSHVHRSKKQLRMHLTSPSTSVTTL